MRLLDKWNEKLIGHGVRENFDAVDIALGVAIGVYCSFLPMLLILRFWWF